MQYSHIRNQDVIAERFKKNDEVFRKTMEGIFQKYSHLDDPGLDVCFKTMTFSTRKGEEVPIDSVEAEVELQNLRDHINNQSLQELDSSQGEHSLLEEMNVTQQTENDCDPSIQMENDNSLWHGAETSQLSQNSVSGCQSYLRDELLQPEEEDDALERTLSSHGSTLLDVYPSMLNQIGKAYHRQHVTEAANAVLRRYRRKRWQSSKAQSHNHGLSNSLNHTLNQTMERSLTAHKTPQSNKPKHPNIGTSSQGAKFSRSNQQHSHLKTMRNSSLASSRSNQELSPLKTMPNSSLASKRSNQELSPLKSIRNSSFASSACFYSPRIVERSPEAQNRSYWKGSDFHLDSKSQYQPVRVLECSPPPSSLPRVLSTDLNQTYNIEPERTSCSVLDSVVCSPRQIVCNSPLKRARSSSLTGQRGRSVTASPSHYCQLGQQFTSDFVGGEHLRDRFYSPTPSPQPALVGGPSSGGRSSFKPTVFNQEEEEEMSSSFYYPSQPIPVNRVHCSEVYRSPYQSQARVPTSPCRIRHPTSGHQENLAMADVHQLSLRPLKRQRSFSGQQSTSSSVSHMSSRQIDKEFRKLYHHFICQGTSTSGPTSSCHLCERQVEEDIQTPTSSSSMSALALTPIKSRLKKRRRQSEGEEFLRLKRFRESRSPLKHTQPWPKQQQQQQLHKYESTEVANSSQDTRIWNRALLLQCPSPGFLRAGGGVRKISGSEMSQRIHQRSSFQRDESGYDAVEARSPMRTWHQSSVSCSPSASRRRLLYGPLQ